MQQHSQHGLNHNLISSPLAWIKTVVIYMAQVYRYTWWQYDWHFLLLFWDFPFLSTAFSWWVTLSSSPTEVCSVNRPPPPPPSCISASSKKKKKRNSNNCNQTDEWKPSGVIQEAEMRFYSPFFYCPTGVYVHTWIRNIGHNDSESEGYCENMGGGGGVQGRGGDRGD